MQTASGFNTTTTESASEFGRRAVYAQSGLSLSIGSQIEMREFYLYLESCRSTLREIGADVAAGPLPRIAERLEIFGFEADTWGFNPLHKVALGLQVYIQNCGQSARDESVQTNLFRGLTLLSALLDQCELEFAWRLAVADMVESLDAAAAGNQEAQSSHAPGSSQSVGM